MTDLHQIRAGLWVTDIVHVGCRPLPGRRAGGPVRIERVGRRWEAHCPGCLDCDPGDYPSLREAAAGTADQWGDSGDGRA